MLNIPWVAHQIIDEGLRRANARRKLLTTIKLRKLSYLSHIRRKRYRIFQLILSRKIEGPMGFGRKQVP